MRIASFLRELGKKAIDITTKLMCPFLPQRRGVHKRRLDLDRQPGSPLISVCLHWTNYGAGFGVF
jgi:hypothetical protein